MPIYSYQCSKCGKEWESCHTVAERYNESCCNSSAKRLITTASKPVVYNYWCHGLGHYITSPKQRTRLMRKYNMEELGTQKL